VKVWSVEGQGSTFTLTLPRKPQLAPIDSPADGAAKPANVAPVTEDRPTDPMRDIRMSDVPTIKENNTP
jgi:hypothetical protein